MYDTEQEPKTTEILSGNFRHINQNSNLVRKNEYFRESLKAPGSGVCWAVAVSEATASLTGQKTEDVLDKIGWLTYVYFPEHYSEISEAGREKPYGFPPFIEEGKLFLVDRKTGGLDRHYRKKYPQQTANLLNYLVADVAGYPIRIQIPPASTLSHYNFLEELGKKYASNKVALLSINVEDFREGKSVGGQGHMVFISGIRKTGDNVEAIRISDPDQEGEFWINMPPPDIINELSYYIGNRKSGNYRKIHPLEAAPLIWLEKQD